MDTNNEVLRIVDKLGDTSRFLIVSEIVIIIILVTSGYCRSNGD